MLFCQLFWHAKQQENSKFEITCKILNYDFQEHLEMLC